MRYFLSVLLSCVFFFAYAQDPVAQKMSWYKQTKSTTKLFVHFDKNIYSNNETIYFTGYLLSIDSASLYKHHLLSVALIRDVDSIVILQNKFVMERGLAFGNLTLLDSMRTGKYHLMAYTDQVRKDGPEVLFSQSITINTPIEPAFSAMIKLLDPNNGKKEKTALINVFSREGRFLTEPIYISYRYGKVTATKMADKSGQLILTLAPQAGLVDPNIYVKIKYKRDSSFISMAIPQPKGKATVKFYPEGGNMVAGIPAVIGWEVKDQYKRPLITKAFLLMDSTVIDTLETDKYGIGTFKLKPLPNKSYQLKLFHSELVDSIYTLPKALVNGATITIVQAVAKDTLVAIIKAKEIQNLMIRVHNYVECFITFPLKMANKGERLKIPLQNLPKGLLAITITDTLNRPLAERIFFAHYEAKKQILIQTDKPIYTQREKVALKIKLADPNSNAVVSIAGVQNSRLSPTNYQDIASFTYLTNELAGLPAHLNGNPMTDKNYMEEVLLVKGWRRYSWQDLEKASEKVKVPQTDSLSYSGQLTYQKKGVNINYVVTFGAPRLIIIPVDSSGNFHINYDQLIAKPQTKLFVLLNKEDRDKVKDKYLIKINDPYQVLNKKLAKLFNPEAPIIPSNLQTNQDLVLKRSEKSTRLKEVVIGPRKDYFKGNACGDYVCPYNILNCVNHIGYSLNTLPVIGKFYLKYSGMPDMIEYKGCDVPNESIFFQVKPIYTAKEFYLSTYSDAMEPAFFSTIYWNYGMLINGQKEATLHFYTSDITGKFRIVVQGVVNNDVAYAEYFFEVKAKP